MTRSTDLTLWLAGSVPEILVVLLVVVLSLAIGLSSGIGAAFGGRLPDAILSRAVEFAGALPTVVAVFVLRAVAPAGSLLAMGATLAVVRGLAAGRSLRAEALQLSREDYVMALRALGISEMRLVRKHVLRHLAPSALAHATTSAAAVVALDGSAAFLGLGASPGSWGSLLAAGASGSGPSGIALPALSTLLLTLLLFGIARRIRDRNPAPPLTLVPDGARAGMLLY